MNGLAKNINESTMVIAFLPVVTVGRKVGLECAYYPGNILEIIQQNTYLQSLLCARIYMRCKVTMESKKQTARPVWLNG